MTNLAIAKLIALLSSLPAPVAPEALATAVEEAELAMKDHTIHFDLPEEQGRIVDRTFYIINEGEPVSVLGKKMIRGEALGAKLGRKSRNRHDGFLCYLLDRPPEPF